MSAKVLLVDDHALVRAGIRKLLDSSPDVEVVGDLSSGRDALALCIEKKPDIVLTDMDMPEINGIELTRQIIAAMPGVSVVVLSMYKSRQYVVESLRAGAKGYLLKDSAITELLSAITAVMKGQRYLSSLLPVDEIDQSLHQPGEDGAVNDSGKLSSRELQILKLLTDGNTSRQIGKLLFISDSTVDAHRWNIMQKLGIHSVAGLTRFAIANGLTSTSR